MSERTRKLLVLVAASAPLVGGLCWLALGRTADPPPDLDAVCARARAGRFDEAQAMLARFLAAFPDHPRAHLLMAQFATDRPDPRPALALEHLRQVRPVSREQAAIV